MLDEDLEIEVELDLDEETVIIDYDEIVIESASDNEDVNNDLPKHYLHIRNLILRNQVQGVVDEDEDLIIVPAYAEKNGELKFFGHIELTAENILDMQNLGLDVSLVRKGKETINFDKADDFVQIIKTCYFNRLPDNHLYFEEEEV